MNRFLFRLCLSLLCFGLFFTACRHSDDDTENPNVLSDDEMPVLSTDVDKIREGYVKFSKSSGVLEYKIGNENWKTISEDEIKASEGDFISVRRRAFGLPDASDYKEPSIPRTILVEEKNLGKKKSSGLDLDLTDKYVSLAYQKDSNDCNKVTFTATPSSGLVETFGTNLSYKWIIEPFGIIYETAKDENQNEIPSIIICDTKAAAKGFPYYITVFVSMNKEALNIPDFGETWSKQIEYIVEK